MINKAAWPFPAEEMTDALRAFENEYVMNAGLALDQLEPDDGNVLLFLATKGQSSSVELDYDRFLDSQKATKRILKDLGVSKQTLACHAIEEWKKILIDRDQKNLISTLMMIIGTVLPELDEDFFYENKRITVFMTETMGGGYDMNCVFTSRHL